MVRGKIPRSENSQELHFDPAKNLRLWKTSGNSEILGVLVCFLVYFYGVKFFGIGRILFMKLNDKLMCGISRKSILFARYGFRTINSCTLQVTCWNQVGKLIKSVDLIFLKGHVRRFHVMPQQPWCSKRLKRRPCWCPKRILRRLFFVNAFFCSN